MRKSTGLFPPFLLLQLGECFLVLRCQNHCLHEGLSRSYVFLTGATLCERKGCPVDPTYGILRGAGSCLAVWTTCHTMGGNLNTRNDTVSVESDHTEVTGVLILGRNCPKGATSYQVYRPLPGTATSCSGGWQWSSLTACVA